MSIIHNYKSIKAGVDRINGDTPSASVDEPQVRVADFVEVKINYGEVPVTDPKIMVEGSIDPRWFGILKAPLTTIEEANVRTYYSTIERQQAEAFFVGMDLATNPDQSVVFSNDAPAPKTLDEVWADIQEGFSFLKSSKVFPG